MATANLGRVGFVNKGTYSGVTVYKVNDIVTYNSGTYACIQANTGQVPTNTSYWQNWVADNAVHKTGDETISGVKTLSNNLVFASGTKIQGDFSNATIANRTALQTSVLNGATRILALPNGTSDISQYACVNNQDPTNSSWATMQCSSLGAVFSSSITGSGTYLPMLFYTSGVERLRIDTSGNVLVTGTGGLGYGTGSGGTVTQVTSKATSVTLNKPSGKIIMHNASLASNGVVTFQFFNSSINIADTVTVNTVAATYVSLNSYDVKAEAVASGYCYVTVKNNTGGALLDSLGIEFNVTKGSIN